MTIPMPGPPEPVPHELDALPHALRPDPWDYCSGCAAENRLRLADPKRLTDAECAAEYWRAASDFRDRLRHGRAGDDLNPEWGRRLIWHRFATRPHALEES